MKKLFWLSMVLLCSCSSGDVTLVRIEGKTMGTTYHIAYTQPGDRSSNATESAILQLAIDSLLVGFNQSVSTYIPTSTISKVNGPDTVAIVDTYFVNVFNRALEVFEKTDGAFDPTVMPLVNGWGFGYADSLHMDSIIVDSLLQLVGFRNVHLLEKDGTYFLYKNDKRIQVDFSAIAKGYGVDIVAQLLEQKGIDQYMVEIGGEVSAKGKNDKNRIWQIGIEKPVENPPPGVRNLNEKVQLENQSMATSGNYRNFYYSNGKKVSHEINPKTGYPAQNNLLSVTVISGDCTSADAFATAFMVMGLPKTIDYLKQDTTLDVYLIYADENGEMQTTYTKRVAEMISKRN